MRTSEPKTHHVQQIASVLRFRSSQARVPQNDASEFVPEVAETSRELRRTGHSAQVQPRWRNSQSDTDRFPLDRYPEEGNMAGNVPEQVSAVVAEATAGTSFRRWYTLIKIAVIAVPLIGATPTALNICYAWKHG